MLRLRRSVHPMVLLRRFSLPPTGGSAMGNRSRQAGRRAELPVVSAGCGQRGRRHGMLLVRLHMRRGKPVGVTRLRCGMQRKL